MSHAKYIPTDRFEELDHIDLDAVFSVLEAYCNNLLPDMEACLVFLRRILSDKSAAAHPKTRESVTHLVRKVRDLGPFHMQGLDLAHKLTGDPALDARLERLRYFELPPELLDFRSAMNDPAVMRRKRTLLMETLERMPGHVLAASQLLQLDAYDGVGHPQWLDDLTVPKFFHVEWNQRIFQHYAALGEADRAMALWPEVSSSPISEIHINLAAELFIKTGDVEQGIALYRHSLTLDPHQRPIQHRIAELEHPTEVDNSLISQKEVCICLYSWNKADDLQRTLKSLAETDIGSASIRILLNGCTDHSNDVVETARALFPNNDFEVISLPVNVGAPAARNWLGSLPEVRSCEFVAYIDDDVELQKDWLTHFLTIMQAHPNTSAVGCKVVFGNTPGMIQYLHRTFSVAETGLIKLTNQNQIAEYDRGQYDFVRTTDTVMGCCHLLRMAHMPEGPQFDLRYSPSQLDDLAHDLRLRLNGGEIRYCGLVTCIHHQNTGGGFKRQMTSAQVGQVMGNDMKLYYSLYNEIEQIRKIMMQSEM